MLVRVDQHPVGASEAATELVEPVAQLRICVGPRVAREPPYARLERLFGQPVAERRREDAAGAWQERLRMARLLGPRHRELHPREQPSLAALDDVPLRLGVRLGAGDPERVEAELLTEPLDLGRRHARIVHS